MAHKKGAGSSKNGRESHSKRLGIKIFGGQKIIAVSLRNQMILVKKSFLKKFLIEKINKNRSSNKNRGVGSNNYSYQQSK